MIDRQDNKLHLLLRKGRLYKIPKGQTVQSSDERFRPLLNLLSKGYIKRYHINKDGTIAVQAIFGPQDVFPLTLVFKSLLGQDIYEGSEVIYYEAMSDVEMYSLDTDVLVAATNSDNDLYKDLLLEAGVRTHSNIQRLENLALKSAYKKVAHQLAYYASVFGTSKNNEVKINVNLTHQDLADILSLTRETVSINIRELKNNQLLSSTHPIVVKDLEKLKKEAFN